MFRPAQVFRELARADARRTWWHKPLVLAFVLGCALSASASGRFSLRLVVDGALSFAFVPALAILALAVVGRTGNRGRLPFGHLVDLFFTGNGPWLLWLIAAAALTLILPPRDFGPWIIPLELSLLIPLAWSLYIDFHFFREVMDRTSGGATKAVILHRLIAWIGFIAYFDGRAAWSEVWPRLAAWIGA